MKLFYTAASPYARKVRVLLREFDIQEVEEVFVDYKDNDPNLIVTNPLGKVPALITGEDEVLFDSQVICEFLDYRYNEGRWTPSTWPEKVAMAAVHGMIDQSVVMIVEKRRPEDKQYDYWLRRYEKAIPRSLQWLYSNHGTDFLATPNILSLSLACLLEYLDFRHPELPWRQQVPEFSEWLESMSHRKSLEVTRPSSS